MSGAEFDPRALAAMMDHTILKPDATEALVRCFCDEALLHGFRSVCVNPIHVSPLADMLAGSTVKTCSAIGFPLGATTSRAKAAETTIAVSEGASEIDVVIARAEVGPDFGVRASDGVRTLHAARAMIAAGANRIGSISIITEKSDEPSDY